MCKIINNKEKIERENNLVKIFFVCNENLLNNNIDKFRVKSPHTNIDTLIAEKEDIFFKGKTHNDFFKTNINSYEKNNINKFENNIKLDIKKDKVINLH